MLALFRFFPWIKSGILAVMLLMANTILAEDFLSITSSNSVKFDNRTGVVLMTGDVSITLRSTGSTLQADKISLNRDLESGRPERIEALGNIQARMNTDNGKRWVEISCDKIFADQKSNLALISGNVHIVSAEMEIKAETVRYDFLSQTGSVINLPQKRVYLVLFEPASTETSEKRRLMAEGWAEEIRLERAVRKITFQGDVDYRDHLGGVSFNANKSDLYFDTLQNPDKITAFEEVTLVQRERSSSADQMFIEYKDKTATLSGNVVIQEPGKMEIKSSMVRMHLDSEKGMITGADDKPVMMNLPVEY